MQIKLLFTHKNEILFLITQKNSFSISVSWLTSFLWYCCSHISLVSPSWAMSVCKIITKIHTKDKSSHSPWRLRGGRNKRKSRSGANLFRECSLRCFFVSSEMRSMKIICLLIDKTYTVRSMLKHFCAHDEYGNFLFLLFHRHLRPVGYKQRRVTLLLKVKLWRNALKEILINNLRQQRCPVNTHETWYDLSSS